MDRGHNIWLSDHKEKMTYMYNQKNILVLKKTQLVVSKIVDKSYEQNLTKFC